MHAHRLLPPNTGFASEHWVYRLRLPAATYVPLASASISVSYGRGGYGQRNQLRASANSLVPNRGHWRNSGEGPAPAIAEPLHRQRPERVDRRTGPIMGR